MAFVLLSLAGPSCNLAKSILQLESIWAYLRQPKWEIHSVTLEKYKSCWLFQPLEMKTRQMFHLQEIEVNFGFGVTGPLWTLWLQLGLFEKYYTRNTATNLFLSKNQSKGVIVCQPKEQSYSPPLHLLRHHQDCLEVFDIVKLYSICLI